MTKIILKLINLINFQIYKNNEYKKINSLKRKIKDSHDGNGFFIYQIIKNIFFAIIDFYNIIFLNNVLAFYLIIYFFKYFYL